MYRFLIVLAFIGIYAKYQADAVCTSVSCDSNRFRYNRCKVPGSSYVTSIRVLHKRSKSPCTYGVSFGKLAGDIWSAHGCRATFRVCYAPGSSVDVSCSSNSYRRATCYAGSGIRRVTLLRHNSKSPCIYGHSYGRTGNNVYVDHGCRAVFRVFKN